MTVKKLTFSFPPLPIILLIFLGYLLYYITIPLLTLHDEPSHIQIVVGLSQGEYSHIWKEGQYAKNLTAVDRIDQSVNYFDTPYQMPNFSRLNTLREEPGDFSMKDVYSHEAFGSLLYYVVGAGVYLFSKLSPYLMWQIYITRLTSLLFFACTVLVAWNIACLFLKDKKIASAVLLFFAINPLVLKMAIGVNPDMGLTFFSLLFLYMLLRIPLKNISVASTTKLTIFSALAALTKVSGVFTNAVFVLCFVLANGVKKKTIKGLLFFEGLFFAIVMPLMVFIYNRYDTFFPEPFTRSCAIIPDGSMLSKLVLIPLSFRHTFMHYSGFMGHAWPHPFNWFFVLFVILFVTLMVIGIFSVLRQKERKYKVLVIYTIPLFIFLSAISLIHRFRLMDCDVQGRYILPVYFVLCIFVYFGLKALVKNEHLAARILIGFAIFHYLFILFTVILLRYYV
jgi:4-amino-4-deoxy-L-arabinose transferase-like glycosyltransferase